MNARTLPPAGLLVFMAVWMVLGVSGCGGSSRSERGVYRPTELKVWAETGRASERRVLQAAVRRFNATHKTVQLALTLIPEGAYNAQVQAAALAGQLPDILELDAPYLASYVWAGYLLPRKLQRDLLPSIVAEGTYRGHLYAVAQFDSGLGLWGNLHKLKQAGVRIPASPARAWTAREFQRVLAALAKHDPDGEVLDLKLNYPGEWFTYAFSPLIESAGGDLIDRRTYQTAYGFLNGPQAVFALRQVQSWIRQGYVDPNIDDAAFTGGRVALAWGGHWNYARYHKALGKDLVLLPLPNFGRHTVTDGGSWMWGITARCLHPRAAAAFLRFLLRSAQVNAMVQANGAVPGTYAALRRSPLYEPGGPLRLFVVQLTEGYAVPRPKTPRVSGHQLGLPARFL